MLIVSPAADNASAWAIVRQGALLLRQLFESLPDGLTYQMFGIGADTVRLPVAVNTFAPQVASITLEPAVTPATRPLLFTVPTPGFDELHVTVLLTLTELPSL